MIPLRYIAVLCDIISYRIACEWSDFDQSSRFVRPVGFEEESRELTGGQRKTAPSNPLCLGEVTDPVPLKRRRRRRDGVKKNDSCWDFTFFVLLFPCLVVFLRDRQRVFVVLWRLEKGKGRQSIYANLVGGDTIHVVPRVLCLWVLE